MRTIPTRTEVESWLRNAWAWLLAFFQKLRKHKKVNEAVTQVQQRLGPELQKIRDDKRVQEAAAKIKPHRRKVIAGLVVLLLAWLILPLGSDPKRATVDYWVSLNKISKEVAADDGEMTGGDSLPELLKLMSGLQAKLNKVQSRIHGLPVANVDEDLLAFTHRLLEALQKFDMVTESFSLFLKEVNAENESSKSFSELVKHFLRGYSGDFTSSFNEMDNLKQERKARFHVLLSQMQAAQAQFNQVRSAQLPLRALLTKKYGVEFE